MADAPEMTTTTIAMATMTIADSGPPATTTTTTTTAVMTAATSVVSTAAAAGLAPAVVADGGSAVVAAPDPAVAVSPASGTIPKDARKMKKGKKTGKGKAVMEKKGGERATLGRAEEWQGLCPTQRHLVRAQCRLVSFHWMPHPRFPRLAVARVVKPEGPDAHYLLEDGGDAEKVGDGFGAAFEARSPMFFTDDARLREVVEELMGRVGTRVMGWCFFEGEWMKLPKWPTLGETSPWCPSVVVERFREMMSENLKLERPQEFSARQLTGILGKIEGDLGMSRVWSEEALYPERAVFCPGWWWGAEPFQGGGESAVREGVFGVPRSGRCKVEREEGTVLEVEVGNQEVMEFEEGVGAMASSPAAAAAPAPLLSGGRFSSEGVGAMASSPAAVAAPAPLPSGGRSSPDPLDMDAAVARATVAMRAAEAGIRRRRKRGTSEERREREASNQRRHAEKVRRREAEEEKMREAAIRREEKQAQDAERRRQDAEARRLREDERQRRAVADEQWQRDEARRVREDREREAARRHEEGRRRWQQNEDAWQKREALNRQKYNVFDARRRLTAEVAELHAREAAVAGPSRAPPAVVVPGPVARGAFRGGVVRGRGASFRGRPLSASRAVVPAGAVDSRLSVSASSAPAAGPSDLERSMQELVGVMTSFVRSMAPAQGALPSGSAAAGGGRGGGPSASSTPRPVQPPRSRLSQAGPPVAQFSAMDYRVSEGLVPAVVSLVGDSDEEEARMQ